MVRTFFCLVVLLPTLAQAGVAQSSPTGDEPGGTVPKGFDRLVLGLDIDRVKEILTEDPNFDFQGDPDVSMLLRPNESLIECGGFSFIDRAYFQFYEKKLYTMTLIMNNLLIDHYTLYTAFVEKYGEPDELSPFGAVWESEDLRFVLERPLSVKYLDRTVFEALKRQGRMEDSSRDLSREQFLDLF